MMTVTWGALIPILSPGGELELLGVFESSPTSACRSCIEQCSLETSRSLHRRRQQWLLKASERKAQRNDKIWKTLYPDAQASEQGS